MDAKIEKSADEVCDALIELLKDERVPGMEPFEQYAARIRATVKETIDLYYQQFRGGYETIIRELATMQEENQWDGNLEEFLIREEKLAAMKSVDSLQNYQPGDPIFQEILGYSNDAMIEMYKIGLKLFDEKEYESCINVFAYLTTLNPFVSSYWIGLGTAYQNSQDYEKALEAFKYGIFTDLDSVDPYMYAGRCCLAMKNPDEAVNIFNAAIEYASQEEKNEKAETLLKEATAMKQYVEKLKSKKRS